MKYLKEVTKAIAGLYLMIVLVLGGLLVAGISISYVAYLISLNV